MLKYQLTREGWDRATRKRGMRDFGEPAEALTEEDIKSQVAALTTRDNATYGYRLLPDKGESDAGEDQSGGGEAPSPKVEAEDPQGAEAEG